LVGTTLYFTADNGVNGAELWKSDGTTPGTVMVTDLNPGAGAGASAILGP
jgi:ELWxxDGT repeat protein